MPEQLKLYGDFDVIAKDADGEVIQRREIDDSGAFTIEDIKRNAVMNGLDEIRIVPRAFETRRGDETEVRVETESGAERSEVPDA